MEFISMIRRSGMEFISTNRVDKDFRNSCFHRMSMFVVSSTAVLMFVVSSTTVLIAVATLVFLGCEA